MRHEYAVFGAYSLHIRIFGAVCDRDEGGDFPAPSAHDAYSGILPASLYAWLERPGQALLAHTQEQLAAAREEVVFLREQLVQKDAVISRLSEAQVEALRRRDILDAQERNALPKPVASRAWWRFWR